MNIFQKNKHGHHVIKLVGSGRNGWDEASYLQDHGYDVGHARDVFQRVDYSTSIIGNGDVVHVVIVPVRDLNCEHYTSDIKLHVMQQFGYLQPLAGVAPLLRIALSDEQIASIFSVEYVAVLAEPINVGDSKGSHVFTVGCLSQNSEGSDIGSIYDGRDKFWSGNVGCAFSVLPQ